MWFCINSLNEGVKEKKKVLQKSFLTALVSLSLQFLSSHSSCMLSSLYPIYLVSSQIAKSSPRSSRKWINPRSEKLLSFLSQSCDSSFLEIPISQSSVFSSGYLGFYCILEAWRVRVGVGEMRIEECLRII